MKSFNIFQGDFLIKNLRSVSNVVETRMKKRVTNKLKLSTLSKSEMHSCKVQEDGKTNPTAINHRGYVGCFSVVLFSTLATSFPRLPPPYASPLRVKVI